MRIGKSAATNPGNKDEILIREALEEGKEKFELKKFFCSTQHTYI